MANVPIVYKEDDIKGMIAAVLALLITLFLLFFIKYHEPDPPKLTIPIPIAMSDEGIEEFEISNAGGGAPSAVSETVPVPQLSSREQATQDESAVSVPTGSPGSTNNSTNETSPPASPFSGLPTDRDRDSPFGRDPGTGDNKKPGKEDTKPTIKKGLGEILTNKITFPAKIHFSLIINSKGDIISILVNRSKTTTTNNALINEVKEKVKKTVKYDERPGAPDTTIEFIVPVTPK